MLFRDKVKKAFGKSNDDPSETRPDLSQVQSKVSTKKPKKQKVEYPDNVYKPGEIPESKYKGPYDKQHQQRLHAFSFGAAFQGRRKSDQSLYSPMGSRMPSRMGSFVSRRSWLPISRQQSRVEDTLMENNEADDAVENGKAPPPDYRSIAVIEANCLTLSGYVSTTHKRGGPKASRPRGNEAPDTRKPESERHWCFQTAA